MCTCTYIRNDASICSCRRTCVVIRILVVLVPVCDLYIHFHCDLNGRLYSYLDSHLRLLLTLHSYMYLYFAQYLYMLVLVSVPMKHVKSLYEDVSTS